MMLLSDIEKEERLRTAILLTYNLDLGWFEALVHPTLSAAGVRRILIVADQGQLSSTLARQSGHRIKAGIEYGVIGVKMPVSFHPKAILLTGDRACRLYVGSGNLTSGGFGRNLELFESWAQQESDEEISPVFDQFRRYLETLIAAVGVRLSPFAKQAWDHAFGVQILTKTQAQDPDTRLAGSPEALFEQLPRFDRAATLMLFLSPFFDEQGESLARLVARYRAKKFKVVTDKRNTNLSAKAARKIKASGGELLFIDEEEHPRLHAKAMYAGGTRWALGVTGSANLSMAAWYGHNAELVTVRQGEPAARVKELLSQLRTRPASAADIKALGEFRPADDEQGPGEPVDSSLALCAARWTGDKRIQIEPAFVLPEGELLVQINSAGTVHDRELGHVHRQQDDYVVDAPRGVSKGRFACVRLRSGEDVGPWIPVDDPAQLAANSQERRRLEEIASDLVTGDDLVNAPMRLLEFLVKLNRARNAAAGKKGEAEPAVEKGAEPVEDEWATILEEDFKVHQAEADRDLPLFQRTGGSLRLINLLLFGSEKVSAADADDGESGADEDAPSGKVDAPEPGKTGSKHQHKRIDLAEIAATATAEYLSWLRRKSSGEIPAGRLVEDMQVLCAALHSAFAMEQLGLAEMRKELNRVLRAFLGGDGAALPTTLKRISGEELAQLLVDSHVLQLVALLLYNYGIAFAQEARVDTDELLLWFQHVLKRLPREVVESSAREIERFVPLLRRGVFWMEEQWAAQLSLNPFANFYRDLVGKTYLYLELSESLSQHANTGVPKRCDGDELSVVQVQGKGFVRPGFAEYEEGTAKAVWLREHPFDQPEAPSDGAHCARIRTQPDKVASMEEICAKLSAEQRERFSQGLEILEKLANS